MVSPEHTNWLFDYGLIEDISVPDPNFSAPTSGFCWPLNASSNVGLEIDGSFGDSDSRKETGSKKRCIVKNKFWISLKITIHWQAHFIVMVAHHLSSGRDCEPLCTKVNDNAKLVYVIKASSSSKACREKLRRDRHVPRFVELGSILEPGRPPKTDKAAILVEAIRLVIQLRGDAQKLKDSNLTLQEKIKELKAEKNELRDEKQRLKAEKERLEQQLKTMNAQPGFVPRPPAIPATYAAQGQPAGNKLVPIISYPGVAMWQFMPPASVDTSQDHVLRPPVA
ncbi:hypothetical protein TEA_018898 [Camellia sinensis var. sinensis]|uniref:BHLH domain-containing protein n=1 Tax=Camellia sinensis var. sinensis TaxID=542762 RepID=A0A4S4DJD0_CAMSN|nr:hypothetical protein TEA_018898 [Camellia sinensis var. sinensis]